MLIERIRSVFIMAPVGALLVALGGIPFGLLVTVVVALAGWEYVRLFRQAKFDPSLVFVITSVVIISLARLFLGLAWIDLILAILALAALTFYLIRYEQGSASAPTDFGISLGGILYWGFVGAYFISLRNLDGGQYWLLTALPCVWAADVGAFSIGRRYGRHKLSPRLSPKKTWEGYWAGVVAGTLAGAILGLGWGLLFQAITPVRGAILGLTLSLLTPLGDLGESMFKRMVGSKDSSDLIPGHGGVMDRIDSWIWAAPICYYLVTLFWS